MGSGAFLEISVGEYSSPCHSCVIHVRVLPPGATCVHDPEIHDSGTKPLWNGLNWSWNLKFFGHHILQIKEERDHLASYQHTRACICEVWGHISVYGLGGLHTWKGNINAQRCKEVSPIQTMSARPGIFQWDNVKAHGVSVATVATFLWNGAAFKFKITLYFLNMVHLGGKLLYSVSYLHFSKCPSFFWSWGCSS